MRGLGVCGAYAFVFLGGCGDRWNPFSFGWSGGWLGFVDGRVERVDGWGWRTGS